MNTEIFKPIEGYEGLYEISNHGRIKSFTRKNTIIRKPGTVFGGYKQVTLSKDGFIARVKVHRLVAQHFVDNPNNYPVVNHLDGIRSNNHYSNLEWCTQSMNMLHASQQGTLNRSKGEERYNAVLTEDIVKQIRELVKTEPQIEIAKRFNLSKSTIFHVVHRYTWKHVA